jgi:hypothetical protein
MSDFKLKQFSGSNIVDVDMSVIKKVEVVSAKEIISNPTLNDYSYTLFVLETISSKMMLNYDEILVILYLNDLVVFGKKIDVPSGWYMLDGIIKRGFADKDYSFKDKDIYRLSEKGINVVDEYLRLFKEKDKWMNLKTTLSDDSVVKSVIADYFS